MPSSRTVLIDPTGITILDAVGKVGVTPEGGVAVKLTNKSGGNSVKGEIVTSSTGTANAVESAGINSDNPIGVFYEDSIADGQEAWIVVSGIAQVLMDASGSTLEYWLGTGGTAKRGTSTISPPAAPTHFQEMGHILETVAANSLAKCILHFN